MKFYDYLNSKWKFLYELAIEKFNHSEEQEVDMFFSVVNVLKVIKHLQNNFLELFDFETKCPGKAILLFDNEDYKVKLEFSKNYLEVLVVNNLELENKNDFLILELDSEDSFLCAANHVSSCVNNLRNYKREKLVSKFLEVEENILGCANLDYKGWDSYSAVPIKYKTMENAAALSLILKSILKLPPRIAPTIGGNINMQWEISKENLVELYIGDRNVSVETFKNFSLDGE